MTNPAITLRLAIFSVACLGSLLLGGCAGRSAVYAPVREDIKAPTGDDFEVLLDHQPGRPYVVTGTLTAQAFANDVSINKLRDRAQAEGLDGIYFIDCTSHCSGHCTAKGFVYADRIRAPEPTALVAHQPVESSPTVERAEVDAREQVAAAP